MRVGYAVHRVGGVASQATAIVAAVLAALGIVLGFVLTTVAGVAQVAGVGFFDAVNLISDHRSPGGRLSSDSVSGIGLAVPGDRGVLGLAAGGRSASGTASQLTSAPL